MDFRNVIKRQKPFWIVLLITVVLWCITVMSEHHRYDNVVTIRWEGYDTVRYLMSSADTVLRFSIESNGFNAMGRQYVLKHNRLVLHACSDTSYTVADCFSQIQSQLAMHGAYDMQSMQDSVCLRLEERKRKAFCPQLRNVEFTFVSPYGLRGVPVLKPDTVLLYGSAASLAKISMISTQPVKINNISESSTVDIPLDPVWRQYPDLRPSVSSVSLYVPTERYVERTFMLPVEVQNSTSKQIRLYPEQVEATFWVPQSRAMELMANEIHLAVNYNVLQHGDEQMAVHVVSFPDYARVKQLQPAEVSFVVIQ